MRQGDFERGWRLHEARKAAKPGDYAWLGRARDLPDGQDFRVAEVLVVSEQGFGDTIHFARYVPPLAARCRGVTLCVQAELTRLLAANLPGVRVVDRVDAVPGTCCAMMSLPLALGLGSDPHIAGDGYLAADAGLARAWEARLAPVRRPRVGLAWAGSRRHVLDRQRSIELADLAPLLAADFGWVSLQAEMRAGEAERAVAAGMPSLGPELTDFAETAALIDRLDLVVTVDTSVAHLAGALGKPVWILLPFSPDWRWGLGGIRTPWYASARLFRQPAPGDWATVLAEVGAALTERFA